MKSFIKSLRKGRVITVIVVLLIAWGAYALWFAPKAPNYTLSSVKRGALTQIVSVTGNTAPVHNVTLAFQTTGVIASANVDVGAHVNAGEVIASLDTRDLQAQLAQARANTDTQAAKLSLLQAGSRPEDIAAAKATLGKAQQDLANMYTNIPSTLLASYAEANDAIRNLISSLFSNAEAPNAQLSFTVNDSQTANDAQNERVAASVELNAWQNELAGINATSPTSTLESALRRASEHLTIMSTLLTTVAKALVEQTSLSSATLTSYKSAVASALTEANTASTAVTNAQNNIASQKLLIAGLQADFDKAVAGATPQDIAAQQAQMEQAQAAAQSISVKITQASLIAPIAGTLTQQDAKVGQIASPGAVLASIISDKGLEVDANIAETDISKITVGNNASMTLDAFPGQTFAGKVSYVDPGETVIEGVATYKTTFQFDLPAGAKPGMTANIDITTATHENALYLPQRAVTTKTDGTHSVQVYHGAGQPIEARAVQTGIRDTNGNLEIVSGLNENDQVVVSLQ